MRHLEAGGCLRQCLCKRHFVLSPNCWPKEVIGYPAVTLGRGKWPLQGYMGLDQQDGIVHKCWHSTPTSCQAGPSWVQNLDGTAQIGPASVIESSGMTTVCLTHRPDVPLSAESTIYEVKDFI